MLTPAQETDLYLGIAQALFGSQPTTPLKDQLNAITNPNMIKTKPPEKKE